MDKWEPLEKFTIEKVGDGYTTYNPNPVQYTPEFEQKLYTDLGVNNFINDFDYPGLKKAYNRINPKYGAARADLFRYAILYKNGGFYIIWSTKNWGR